MTETERKLLEALTALIPKLSEMEKLCTLSFLEGYAFKAGLTLSKGKSA